MNLRKSATNAANEVRQTAEKIGTSVQWNTVALVAVSVLSAAALFIATAALLKGASSGK